jgi:hypothetical protein
LALVVALALPAQGGTAASPEVTDPAGDAKLLPLDIAAAWFDADDAHLNVHIQRGDGADTAPTAVRCSQGACVGAGVSLRVVFTVLRADGAPAPTLDGYASSYVLVRIGPDDPALSAATGYYDGDGTPTLEETLNATVDGTQITVSVPLSSVVVGLANGLEAGARVGSPYALSYILTCDPEQGCGSLSPPVEQLAPFWDRAPDSGTGADYWLPAPAPSGSGSGTTEAPASATTVTVVETQTQTVTRTETQEQTETVTFTPAAVETHVKASPAAGILVAAGIVALAAVRRRLA